MGTSALKNPHTKWKEHQLKRVMFQPAFLDDIGGIQGVSLHIYPDCFVTRNDGEQGGFFTRTANFWFGNSTFVCPAPKKTISDGTNLNGVPIIGTTPQQWGAEDDAGTWREFAEQLQAWEGIGASDAGGGYVMQSQLIPGPETPWSLGISVIRMVFQSPKPWRPRLNGIFMGFGYEKLVPMGFDPRNCTQADLIRLVYGTIFSRNLPYIWW